MCFADVSSRDLNYIKSRIENEGLSFLTITLPKFCRDFERALQTRLIDSTMFLGFRKIGSIPAFLQGMTSQIFDLETGRYYNEKTDKDVSVYVDAIRQICLLFKKIELPCTPEREYKAILNFIDVEHDVQQFSLSTEDTDRFRSVSNILWAPLVSSIELSNCRPKHGPGATAEHVSGNQKFAWREWNDRLEPYFPLVDSGYPLGIPESAKELESVTIKTTEEETPVRVVLVPKTLTSPRIIAIEPCCNQFIQQGIRDQLYAGIESDRLARGHVNFTDQTINQRLAIKGSRTGRLATIDLSDASDRVPRSLALEMFSLNPDLRDAIDACRSTRALLPTGEILSPLYKFASMGSALCFPIEAMYFYTICVVALLELLNLPISFRNVKKVSRRIYVYGDDIIVPSAYANGVLDYLQKYNCKVNPNKTFVSGSFRESCGIDAYGGLPVTPVYLRHEHPKDARQHGSIISWVSTANSFYMKGYWRTATYMRKYIEAIVGVLPYVSMDSSVVGHKSLLGYTSIERWNRNLQTFEIRGLTPVPVYRPDRLDGYGALFKCFQKLEKKFSNSGDSSKEKSSSIWSFPERGNVRSYMERNRVDFVQATDPLHLERSALHGTVALKRRWVAALK
jgi:hypothetical protein